MTKKIIEIENYSSTPYDDVYRTLVNDCPGLIIPVVNEVFGKAHKTDEEITILNNELFLNRQNGKQLERITDSNFRIEGIRYHIECQSTVDGSILLRIFEYDSQIALQDAVIDDDTLFVQFPNTAVMYLRHNENTPEFLNIVIIASEDHCIYRVPVMKVQNYSIDEIFEKKLYFLIPFHIFTYEKSFKEYNKDAIKRKELIGHYNRIMNKLEQEVKNGHINEFIRRAIIDMSKKVLDNISANYNEVREGVRQTMGGQILEYEAKDILNKGIAVGVEQGLEQGLVDLIVKKLIKSKPISQIADELELSEERILELIEKYSLSK